MPSLQLQLHLDLTCQVRQLSALLCLSSESPHKLLRVLHCSGSPLASCDAHMRCDAHFRVALEKTAYLPLLLLLACGPICSLIGGVSSVSIVVQSPFWRPCSFFLLGRCVDLNLLPASDGRPMAYVFVRAAKFMGLWTSSGSVPEVKVNCMSLILTDHLRVFSFCGGKIGLWSRIMLGCYISCAHFLSSHSLAFHRPPMITPPLIIGRLWSRVTIFTHHHLPFLPG